MLSSTIRRGRNATRVAAGMTLAAALITGGGGVAGAADRPPSGSPSHANTAGGLKAETVLTPPAPQRLTASGLRPLSPAEADWLRGDGRLKGGTCELDFDDDAAIALIPGGAQDTFAYSPFWNQLCGGGRYARVFPTTTDHLHLGYVDSSIGPCLDPDNPHGTPGGVFSRGEDCEPIDPVTEPRSSITVGHYAAHWGRLDLIDAYGSDYTPRPFTLERMRILTGPARVCYRMPPEGPWIAAGPVGPFDHPGLVYCWASLAPGYWDLSDWTGGTVGVSFTGASDTLPGYDDFRLG